MSVNVTVYTGTGSSKVIATNATKWSELQNDLSRNGISYNASNTKAVVGETENTLESNDAQVPANDFTLFLLPQKVKSGYEESYEDSDEYSDDDDDEVEVAPAASISPENWTKADADKVLVSVIQSLQQLRTYVQHAKVNPLDQKAQELINKMFK